MLKRYAKMLVALVGVAATVAATIPQDSAGWRWAQLILAVATVVGVRQTPNAPPTTGIIMSETRYERPREQPKPPPKPRPRGPYDRDPLE